MAAGLPLQADPVLEGQALDGQAAEGQEVEDQAVADQVAAAGVDTLPHRPLRTEVASNNITCIRA